ncbi:MAG: carbamate kinase [Thermoplasmataceae archaeon]|jgi:carbamate kinase
MERIVIAFGGNALLRSGDKATYEIQLKRATDAFEKLTNIIQNNEVVISHGNGPQVGGILLQNEASKNITPSLPLHSCGAMSQGLIGEILLNAYDSVRARIGFEKNASVIVTRTLVDKNDPAFTNPSKPIGPFYKKEEAEELARANGWIVREEKGKGYRRIVASPQPLEIVERPAIISLLMSGLLPIASGGGGIPVVKSDHGYSGADAVIDKDLASSFLAITLKAQRFVILTDVENVILDFGTSHEKKLCKLSAGELEKYYKEGHFPGGSMGPKVKAVVEFVKKTGGHASIGSLDHAEDVVSEKSGTQVFPD